MHQHRAERAIDRIREATCARLQTQDPRMPKHLQQPSIPFERADSPIYRICLEQVAAAAQPASFLEIGVKRGESLQRVLDSTEGLKTVTLCDFWTVNAKKRSEHDLVRQRIDEARSRHPHLKAEFLDGSSLLTLHRVSGKYDLIGIDGSHRRDVFRSDLSHAKRLIAYGGHIAVDDLILHEDHKIDQELLAFVRGNIGEFELVHRDITHWPGAAVLRRVGLGATIQGLAASAIATNTDAATFSEAVRNSRIALAETLKFAERCLADQDWQALDLILVYFHADPPIECAPLLRKILATGSLEIDMRLAHALLERVAPGRKSEAAVPINGLCWAAPQPVHPDGSEAMPHSSYFDRFAVADHVRKKVRRELDTWAVRFLGLSPFAVLATRSAQCDLSISPRGGPPGFIRVLGPREVEFDDAPGNNLFETYRNIEHTSDIGILSFIPGIQETLRLRGKARLVLPVGPNSPEGAKVRVSVTSCYYQCGRALKRAGLWDTDRIVATRDRKPLTSRPMREE